MKRKKLAAIILCTAVPLACARGNSDADAEYRESGVPQMSAEALVGNWDLASDPPVPPPGLHVSFTVDSVAGARYFGRLTHYFTGNVGGDLSAFKPFAASLGSDGRVEFKVEQRDPSMLGIVVVGQLGIDTIPAELLVIGPDTLSKVGNRTWFLVKR